MAGCIKYQKSKADSHSSQTKLVQKRTGVCPVMQIPMNFVRELPKSEAFYTILVITNCFTKVHLYILAKTTGIAADVADTY